MREKLSYKEVHLSRNSSSWRQRSAGGKPYDCRGRGAEFEAGSRAGFELYWLQQLDVGMASSPFRGLFNLGRAFERAKG